MAAFAANKAGSSSAAACGGSGAAAAPLACDAAAAAPGSRALPRQCARMARSVRTLDVQSSGLDDDGALLLLKEIHGTPLKHVCLAGNALRSAVGTNDASLLEDISVLEQQESIPAAPSASAVKVLVSVV